MQIKITLKPEIYEQIKKNAKDNMRTLSAEINFTLQKAYQEPQAQITQITNESKPPKREGDFLW